MKVKPLNQTRHTAFGWQLDDIELALDTLTLVYHICKDAAESGDIISTDSIASAVHLVAYNIGSLVDEIREPEEATR